MSDVVAAALIAASVGVVGNFVTAFVALKTTSRQTKANGDRLRDDHREADRRVRRDAYARLLGSLETLDLLTSAYTPPPARDDFDRWLHEFRAAGVSVQLVESTALRESRGRVGQLLNALAEETIHRFETGEPMEDALGLPYVRLRPALNDAGRALASAMRDDLAFAAD